MYTRTFFFLIIRNVFKVNHIASELFLLFASFHKGNQKFHLQNYRIIEMKIFVCQNILQMLLSSIIQIIYCLKSFFPPFFLFLLLKDKNSDTEKRLYLYMLPFFGSPPLESTYSLSFYFTLRKVFKAFR